MWQPLAEKTAIGGGGIMKKIELYYNPFLEQAKLKIDGESYEPQGGRLGEFLIGKPMESWLEKRVISYQRWDGILPELIEFLNDDELQIQFYGIESDYDHFSEYIKRQNRDIELKGFESDLYTLEWIEKWNPKPVYQNLQMFLQNRIGFAPTQKTMLSLEYVQANLNSSEAADVPNLRMIREELEQIVNEILRQCNDGKLKNTWENARRELVQIFY